MGRKVGKILYHAIVYGTPRHSPIQQRTIKLVTATKGKIVRAEPVAALYEQRKIGHWGIFPKLEDQLCEFTGDDSTEESPDRLDALVWGLTELLLTGRAVPYVAVSGATAPSYWAPPGSGSDSSVTVSDTFISMS